MALALLCIIERFNLHSITTTLRVTIRKFGTQHNDVKHNDAKHFDAQDNNKNVLFITMPFRRMTLSNIIKCNASAMAFRIMILGIMALRIIIRKCGHQHNDIQHDDTTLSIRIRICDKALYNKKIQHSE